MYLFLFMFETYVMTYYNREEGTGKREILGVLDVSSVYI